MKIGRRGFLGSLVAAASLPATASKVVAKPPAPALPMVYGSHRSRFGSGIDINGAWYQCRNVRIDYDREVIRGEPIGGVTRWYIDDRIGWSLSCEIPGVVITEELGAAVALTLHTDGYRYNGRGRIAEISIDHLMQELFVSKVMFVGIGELTQA